MANKKLGIKLKELRNRNEMTQQYVSDILGLKNKSTLASWEGGKSEPDSETFIKLCKIYGLKDFSFFADEDAKKKTPTIHELAEALDTVLFFYYGREATTDEINRLTSLLTAARQKSKHNKE